MSSTVRRAGVLGLVAALAGAGGAWAGGAMASSAASSSALSTSAGRGSRPPSATATGLATVTRADLASEQSIPGTIGYDGSWTVVLPGGTDAAALAQAQQKVTADRLALGADQTSVADTAAANVQSVDQAASALDAARANPHDQAAVRQAIDGLAGAQQHAIQTLHQVQAQVNIATATLQADEAALAGAQRTALTAAATLTAVPATGQVVTEGQPLYALDGHPVPLLYGSLSGWRAFQAGMDDGQDVAELNQSLSALGFEAGPSPGAHFQAATAAGIRRLQASLALSQTGTLRLGDVVFEPGPLRIASVSVHPGSPAQPGATVVVATSTTLVVTALVPLANVGQVKAGDAVTIDLPDGRTGIRGQVRDVGASVSPATGGGGGQGGGASGNQGGGSGGATSVPATVVFSDPSIAQGLDQGAVVVHITTNTARGVLAVPVEALLALSGGGEGVEVVRGGVHRIVAVQTGVFTGTQVAIRSAGIAPGDQVEVPAP